MANTSKKLDWCKVRLGKDLNWWVTETSDNVNWDVDGLSIIDPRQSSHILETLEGLRPYGLDDSIVSKAFIVFSIDSRIGKDGIKLVRSDDSVFDAESQELFLLPDTLDEERSPYAEFLDHITKLQVKMLNDTFHFEQDLEIEDLEEQIREKYSNDYMEGRAIHSFIEIIDILEYVPAGYSLDDLDEDAIHDYFTEHFKGDCLLAVGDEDLIKIHFHTNEPWKVLEYCSTLGEIFDIVIEDMDRQERGLKG